ncbi:MAG: chromosomal replication initiator protein DnaA [Bacteriovoracaceae bacterium]|jgi:chromosomal replication initiator protein|nr:chromosomal replication initiator protein DnaA [Bacteriovoracaceae bacterium]
MEKEFPFNAFFDPENSNNTNDFNSLHSDFNELPKHGNDSTNSPTTGNQDLEGNDLEQLNKFFSEELEKTISPQKYNTFFKSTFCISAVKDNNIEFSVTTPFIKTMIENHYLSILKSLILQVLGEEYEVSVEVVIPTKMSLSSNKNNILDSINLNKSKSLADEIRSESLKRSDSVKDHTFRLDLHPSADDLQKKVESKVLAHLKDIHFGQLIDPNKTFDNFVIGPSNNMAYATAVAVSKNPGKAYPCLYLYSRSGLGKTHLLHSVANNIKRFHPQLKICITTARDFMTEMIEAMQQKKINDFRKKYSESIDVLMVDDVHELKDKPSTQNEFFHVFNELHNKGKQLIFTSDKEPKEIVGIEERIKTRLSWGLVQDMQPPDLETRIAILKQKALKEDIYIPDEVINLVASAIKNNIRELEGSLIKLAAYSSVFQVDIDTEIAKEQLKLNDFYDPKCINLESVIKAISSFFKIPIADLKSKSRSKDIATARHIGMYLSYKVVQSTYSEIGSFYGKRDHTTAMHAVEKIKKQLKTDARLCSSILEIENSL